MAGRKGLQHGIRRPSARPHHPGAHQEAARRGTAVRPPGQGRDGGGGYGRGRPDLHLSRTRRAGETEKEGAGGAVAPCSCPVVPGLVPGISLNLPHRAAAESGLPRLPSCFAWAGCPPVFADANEPREYRSERHAFRLVRVGGPFDQAWGMAFLPDGRMLVTELDGNLRILEPGKRPSDPLPGLPRIEAYGQGGLMDVALDPGLRGQPAALSQPHRGHGGRLDHCRQQGAAGRRPAPRGSRPSSPAARRGAGAAISARGSGSRKTASCSSLSGIAATGRAPRTSAPMPGAVLRLNPDGTAPPDNPFAGRSRRAAGDLVLGAPPTRRALPSIRKPAGCGRRSTGRAAATRSTWSGAAELRLAGHHLRAQLQRHENHGRDRPAGHGAARDLLDALHCAFGTDCLSRRQISRSGTATYSSARCAPNSSSGWSSTGEREWSTRERLLTDFGNRIRDVRTGPDGLIYLLLDEKRRPYLAPGAALGCACPLSQRQNVAGGLEVGHV